MRLASLLYQRTLLGVVVIADHQVHVRHGRTRTKRQYTISSCSYHPCSTRPSTVDERDHSTDARTTSRLPNQCAKNKCYSSTVVSATVGSCSAPDSYSRLFGAEGYERFRQSIYIVPSIRYRISSLWQYVVAD